MKCRLLKVAFLFVAISLFFPLFAQSNQNNGFPQGSTQGRTEMNPNVNQPVIPNISVEITEPQSGNEVAFSVRLLVLLTILTLAPSILILLTCFLRFSIVLDFIKRALSLQQVPPTAVLNGIAFFMTLFAMWPTFSSIYDKAYKPLSDGQIGIEEAYHEAEAPLRLFMYTQMADDTSYMKMFMNMAKLPKPNNLSEVPTYILIPSYILHELTVALR